MANTKSAKKAARQTLRRTEVNRTRVSRMRSSISKVEDAIAAGDKAAAAAALKAAQPILMRTAKVGVVHKNTVSRKISRLSARIKALKA
ncbi:MAG: 30S ribosomal protein S20 [Rhodospirillales bacterium]|nr:30S ribosomal protein S20 [Rhodospirillales bacterium]